MPRTLLTTTFASDEDAYIIGGPDFAVIVPESNLWASGTDGAFDPSDRWTLNSAAEAFAAQGVEPGMVLQITGPRSVGFRAQFLAVDSVGTNSVALRRCGAAAVGGGHPPGAAAGQAGVQFQVLTLKPQLEDAANFLDDHFAVNEATPYRTPSDMTSRRAFRRLTVLRVFFLLYTAENKASVGEYTSKQDYYKKLYTEELDQTTVRWGTLGVSQPATSHFTMRVGR